MGEDTTTKNMVPELRFPEFHGDWEEKKLGGFLTVERGASPRPINKYITSSHDGVNWIKIGDIKEGAKYIKNTEEKITKKGSEKSRKVEIGDFILSNSMSFGRPYILKINGCIHDGWLKLRNNDKGNLSDEFLYNALSTDNVKKKFLSLAAGSAVRNLKSETVKSAKIRLPSKAEQQKIAEFLRSVDEWIENLQAQKASLEQYKKGMMQKIFSQEIRFKDEEGQDFPDWEEKKLGEVGDFQNGYSFKSKSYDNEGKYKIINIGCVQKRNLNLTNVKTLSNLPEDIQSHQILRKGDLLVSMTGNVGRVCKVDEINCVLNQRVGKIISKKELIDKNFLYQYLTTDEFEFKMNALSQGGGQGNISKKDILGFSLTIPTLSEQQKIAEFFQSLDDLIQSKEQQITKAQEWKKGLMQRLFI